MANPFPHLLSDSEWAQAIHRARLKEGLTEDEAVILVREDLVSKAAKYPPHGRLQGAVPEPDPEITLIRDLALGMDPDEVSVELEMDYQHVVEVVTGMKGANQGGMIHPLDRKGLRLDTARHRFVTGVLAQAKASASPEQLAVLAHQNGLTVDQVNDRVDSHKVESAEHVRIKQRRVLAAGTSSKRGKEPEVLGTKWGDPNVLG